MEAVIEKNTHPFYPFFKRLFDLAFSTTFITIFSPVYLALALLIKLGSKGPIFYIGKRLGKGGKHVTIYKFRTMYLDAEERLEEMLKNNPKMREEWEVYQKLQDDPRCTPIGKFLRKTSLDEFPQFLNVIKGDLSVVGPRPHYIEELEGERNSPLKKYAQFVLSVKPGITGLWQISGRNHLSYEDRVELDSLYYKKQSFFYDLMVVLKTIPLVLISRGAV
ncbi:sugar transferase [Candidatus Neptunochlamydia vexilliferae]|nr:sugar transferase [Candidatus Neptunochlamydia vexilliferae]